MKVVKNHLFIYNCSINVSFGYVYKNNNKELYKSITMMSTQKYIIKTTVNVRFIIWRIKNIFVYYLAYKKKKKKRKAEIQSNSLDSRCGVVEWK